MAPRARQSVESPRGGSGRKEEMSLKCEGAKQEDVSEEGAAEGLTAADPSSANAVRLLFPLRPRAREVGCFLLLSQIVRRHRAGSRTRVFITPIKREVPAAAQSCGEAGIVGTCLQFCEWL